MKRGQEAEDAFRKAAQNELEDIGLLRALAQQPNANGKKAKAQQFLKKAAEIEESRPPKRPQTPKFEVPAG